VWSSVLRIKIGAMAGSFERGHKYSNFGTDGQFVEGEGVLFFQQ
jgi:hypothetical protein